jgi:hypothetical protein
MDLLRSWKRKEREEKEVLPFCAGEMLLTAMPHEDAVAC